MYLCSYLLSKLSDMKSATTDSFNKSIIIDAETFQLLKSLKRQNHCLNRKHFKSSRQCVYTEFRSVVSCFEVYDHNSPRN